VKVEEIEGQRRCRASAPARAERVRLSRRGGYGEAAESERRWRYAAATCRWQNQRSEVQRQTAHAYGQEASPFYGTPCLPLRHEIGVCTVYHSQKRASSYSTLVTTHLLPRHERRGRGERRQEK